MSSYAIGQRVRAKAAIYEPADDHDPGGYLCRKGDVLVIRRISSNPNAKRSLSVSHEDVTDGTTFAVEPDEVITDGVSANGVDQPKGGQRCVK